MNEPICANLSTDNLDLDLLRSASIHQPEMKSKFLSHFVSIVCDRMSMSSSCARDRALALAPIQLPQHHSAPPIQHSFLYEFALLIAAYCRKHKPPHQRKWKKLKEKKEKIESKRQFSLRAKHQKALLKMIGMLLGSESARDTSKITSSWNLDSFGCVKSTLRKFPHRFSERKRVLVFILWFLSLFSSCITKDPFNKWNNK